MTSNRTIAYFSMEIGLEVGMPTYSGGLGVLAVDTIRSAADLKVPLVDRSKDALEPYDKLKGTVIPMYYEDHDRLLDLMRHAIALNGSFFNTQRMMQEYGGT